ncbi:hypothetical protein [Eisenbergiella sp.]
MGHQLVVGAAFYDFAFFNYEDQVGIADGGEAVGYGYDGAFACDAVDGLLDLAFGFHIDGGSGFIDKMYPPLATLHKRWL